MLDRTVPKSLDPVVLKALSRELPGRYESAAAFQRAIEGWLSKQRLPATTAHLAAFMKQLFPDEAEAVPLAGVDTTMSTDKSAVAIEPPQVKQPEKIRANQVRVLDQKELEARISGTQESDHLRGMFFNALISAVLRSVGPAAEPKVRKAALAPRAYVDSLTYPTAEFLRMLWKSVELLAPKLQSVDEAFEQLGFFTMDALLKSPFGRSLETLKDSGPRALFKPLLATLNPMISPGNRLVADATDRSARLVFKEEVLPIQLYVGLVRSLFVAFFDKELQATWEKTAAERVECSLSWK
jgi:uncharacterized protein (TIGR02265 family)